jgi:hypothetical protein
VSKDFAPVALIAKMPHLLIATQALAVSNIGELLALEKPARQTDVFLRWQRHQLSHGGRTVPVSSNTSIVHVPIAAAVRR